jgi:hypothetical protein
MLALPARQPEARTGVRQVASTVALSFDNLLPDPDDAFRRRTGDAPDLQAAQEAHVPSALSSLFVMAVSAAASTAAAPATPSRDDGGDLPDAPSGPRLMG